MDVAPADAAACSPAAQGGELPVEVTLQVPCGPSRHEILLRLTPPTVQIESPCTILPAAARTLSGSSCMPWLAKCDEVFGLAFRVGGTQTLADLFATLQGHGTDVADALELGWSEIIRQCEVLGARSSFDGFGILVSLLDASNQSVVAAAVDALQSVILRAARKGGESSLAVIVQATKIRHLAVALPAIRSLGAFAELAIGPLAEFLENERPELRAAAVEAFGAIGGLQALPHLNELLADSESVVRDAAEQALVTIIGAESRKGALTLNSALRMLAVCNPAVAAAAAQALGRIGDPRAVRPLVHACITREPALVPAATEAIVALSGPQRTIPLFIAHMKLGDNRLLRNAVSALVTIGEPAVPHLEKVLRWRLVDARRAAALGLGRIADLRSVPALKSALNDQDHRVRGEAQAALRRMEANDPQTRRHRTTWQR